MRAERVAARAVVISALTGKDIASIIANSLERTAAAPEPRAVPALIQIVALQRKANQLAVVRFLSADRPEDRMSAAYDAHYVDIARNLRSTFING